MTQDASSKTPTKATFPQPSSSSSSSSFVNPAELRWCSKNRRSAPPKRITKNKLLRFINLYKLAFERKVGGRSMAPKRQLYYGPLGARHCDKLEIVVCANFALSSWNSTSLSQQGPEYKVVEFLYAFYYERQKLYHCNFTARPKKNTSEEEAEDKLFFAELQHVPRPESNGKYDLLCHFCCILGPSGCETGNSYCGFCELAPNDPYVVHRPEAGFTKAGSKLISQRFGCSTSFF